MAEMKLKTLEEAFATIIFLMGTIPSIKNGLTALTSVFIRNTYIHMYLSLILLFPFACVFFIPYHLFLLCFAMCIALVFLYASDSGPTAMSLEGRRRNETLEGLCFHFKVRYTGGQKLTIKTLLQEKCEDNFNLFEIFEF